MPSLNVKAAFGLQLRHLRQTRGWSQERLAAEVGLDRSYVGSVERGERNISLENIARFAKALGLDLTQLMDFDHA
ncbi:MAG: helix-turn-helix transcriptional regulator [Phycisphaerae bacterium]|nr:helix-turn-helix transcriptional regulator [Phycisphaerae bacterium]